MPDAKYLNHPNVQEILDDNMYSKVPNRQRVQIKV